MTNSLRFSHVALNCRDPLATERYYAKHFGFRRARVVPVGDDQIVFLRGDDVLLELFRAEGPSGEGSSSGDGPHGVGVRHVAFQVEDVDAQLSRMGADADVTLGPLDFDEVIPGWRTVWVRDPDGHVVEISQGYRDEAEPTAG